MDVRDRIEEELSKDNIPKYKRNRLLAMKYYINGSSLTEISAEIGISLRSVQRYVKEYTEKGDDSFFGRRPPGNSNALTSKQKEELIQDIGKSPRYFGYTLSKWSPSTLAMHLEEKFGVTMSLESCRAILKDHHNEDISNLQRVPLHKIKKEFDATINRLLSETNNAVWIFGQFYVGFRAAYKTKNKHKKRRAAIMCAKQCNSSNTVCHFVNPYRDKKEQWEELINAVLARSEQDTLFFFLPKSQYNKHIASRFINRSKKKLSIDFLPTGLRAHRYMEDVKYKIIDGLNLPYENTEGKTLGKRKQKQLEAILQKLSTPSRA